jgi:large subunit ribosomal protein L24e
MKWTKAFRKTHGKEMATDSTFEFEKRRHEPQKYDRNLMKKTLVAMKKIQQIKSAREERFYKNRMAGNKALEKKLAIKDIKQGIDLVVAPLARKKAVINEATPQTLKAAVAFDAKHSTGSS